MSTDRCAPGPDNSCTVAWTTVGTGPNARIRASTRQHPTGGLEETCDDTEYGQAIKMLGGRTIENPPDGVTESQLRVTDNGETWVNLQPKTRYELPAGVAPNVTTGTNLMDRSITIDTTNFTQDSCWEICVDICDAYIDTPTGTGATVTIPPGGEITVGDAGGTFTHSHGTINVTPAPASGAVLSLTIGGTTCQYLAADKFFGAYSGRICRELTIPAGQANTVPIQADIATAAVDAGFTASSGSMTVYVQRIECSEAG